MKVVNRRNIACILQDRTRSSLLKLKLSNHFIEIKTKNDLTFPPYINPFINFQIFLQIISYFLGHITSKVVSQEESHIGSDHTALMPHDRVP